MNFLVLLTILIVTSSPSFAGKDAAIVTIDANLTTGKINKNFFGAQFTCTNNCPGILAEYCDVLNTTDVSKSAGAFKALNPGRIRNSFFSGNNTIFTEENAALIDKFLLSVKNLNNSEDYSNCIFLLNPQKSFTGMNTAIIAYLNTPIENPIDNKHGFVLNDGPQGTNYKNIGYWANLRAKNGHPKPYNIKYFEMGEESYKQSAGFEKDPSLYCKTVQEMIRILRIASPNILCGLNFEVFPDKNQKWREGIIKEGGQFADFFVCRMQYPNAFYHNKPFDTEKPPVKNTKGSSKKKRSVQVKVFNYKELYYKMIMAGSVQAVSDMAYTRRLIKELLPEKADSIPIFLSENGIKIQDMENANEALPYSLASGLMNTDQLGLFLENAQLLNIEGAVTSFIVGNHCKQGKDQDIILRPQYYSLYMWTNFFGSTLLKTELLCNYFEIENPKTDKPYGGPWPESSVCWSSIAQRRGIPVLSAHSSLSEDESRLYLIVINRNLTSETIIQIVIKGFSPDPSANIYTLSSSIPSGSKSIDEVCAVMESNNETKPDTVKLFAKSINSAGNYFTYILKPRTATAFVFTKRKPGQLKKPAQPAKAEPAKKPTKKQTIQKKKLKK